MTHDDLVRQLEAVSDPKRAAFLPSFFKTGPGQYGEGDVFLGVTVPQVRAAVKRFRGMPLAEIDALLAHPTHEFRLAGVLLLVQRYQQGDEHAKAETVDFYLSHLARVNNWDLVDTSAPYILGDWLLTRDRSVLDKLAASGELWKERVAIVATYAFIRAGQFEDTLRMSEKFLNHKHDLIHKAAGWMLREAGKKDQKTLERFLDTHAAAMPRTMLRYALERFDPALKARYMAMGKRGKSSILKA